MERELTRNEELWELFEAVRRLEDADQCALFLRDLCTLSELQALAERWQVARLVDQGIPYRRISELTGASTATITRVAHWVNHGEGGYRAMLDKIRSEE